MKIIIDAPNKKLEKLIISEGAIFKFRIEQLKNFGVKITEK